MRLAYFPITRNLFYTIAKHRIRRVKSVERKLFLSHHLIMLYLHHRRYQKAEELENYIQGNPELKSKQRFILGYFQPSGFEYSGRCFRIVVDSRVLNLSGYLLSDIEDADEWLTKNFPDLETCTTFFFMDGSGPSPFNAKLNDVYLKVRHYRKNPHDREIVIHAIVHEITHMHLRNTLGFRICSNDSGIRKFFDEGFAQLCGFRAAHALERKSAHADTCARSATATGLSTLQDMIQDWENTVFQMRYYPLYQSALSFIVFLEREIGSDALLELFRNTNCDVELEDVIKERTGRSFSSLMESWSSELGRNSITNDADFFRIIRKIRASSNSLQVEYSSDHPLYPTKDILVYNSCNQQLAVSTIGKYRYRESGSFSIECQNNTQLNFVIAFDSKEQRLSTESAQDPVVN